MKRPDESMTLLREVIERPLDGGYAEAARRRASGEQPAAGPTGRILIVLVAAALGFSAVWAARELRAPVPTAGDARILLIDEITARSEQRETLSRDNAELAESITALQNAALELESDVDLETRSREEIQAGAARLRGPGLVITLDDSRDAQAGLPGADNGRVQDIDLQVVVNGLWAAGAEAISINGQRLTSVSAIRSAGSAILVDLVPLSRPYLVEVIGDADLIEADLARLHAGGHLHALRESFGIAVDIVRLDEIEIPATSARSLRFAAPAQDEIADGRSSAPGSVGGVG